MAQRTVGGKVPALGVTSTPDEIRKAKSADIFDYMFANRADEQRREVARAILEDRASYRNAVAAWALVAVTVSLVIATVGLIIATVD